ncbi:MAG: hypothetical protein ACYCZX_10410 [Rhodospirillaceae bacterium]
MLARILRLVVVLTIVAAVLVLFIYAFLAALIAVPVFLVLFFLFGRRIRTVWIVGQPLRSGDEPAQKPGPPVIDHDPNDLSDRDLPQRAPPENKQ